jgi:hypothetical protein
MALNKAEQARARAERSALALLLRERSKSNASGVHNNKAGKRGRTRSARLARLIKEGLENA